MIDSQDIIVSETSSSSDYYSGNLISERCITIGIRPINKTPKNPESARKFHHGRSGYTAYKSVAVHATNEGLLSKFSARDPCMEFHVCVYAACVSHDMENRFYEFRKSLEFKGSEKLYRLKHTRIDIKSCIKNIHELISININQYQYHITSCHENQEVRS